MKSTLINQTSTQIYDRDVKNNKMNANIKEVSKIANQNSYISVNSRNEANDNSFQASSVSLNEHDMELDKDWLDSMILSGTKLNTTKHHVLDPLSTKLHQEFSNFYSMRFWLRLDYFVLIMFIMIYNVVMVYTQDTMKSADNHSSSVAFKILIVILVIIFYMLVVGIELVIAIMQIRKFECINPLNIKQIYSIYIKSCSTLSSQQHSKDLPLIFLQRQETIFGYIFFVIQCGSLIVVLVFSLDLSSSGLSSNLSSETTSVIYIMYIFSVVSTKFFTLWSNKQFEIITFYGNLILVIAIIIISNCFSFSFFVLGSLGLAFIAVSTEFYLKSVNFVRKKNIFKSSVSQTFLRFYKNFFDDSPASYLIIDKCQNILYTNEYFKVNLSMLLQTDNENGRAITKIESSLPNLHKFGVSFSKADPYLNLKATSDTSHDCSNALLFNNDKTSKNDFNRILAYTKEEVENKFASKNLNLSGDTFDKKYGLFAGQLLYMLPDYKDFSNSFKQNTETNPNQLNDTTFHVEQAITLKAQIERFLKSNLEITEGASNEFTSLGKFRFCGGKLKKLKEYNQIYEVHIRKSKHDSDFGEKVFNKLNLISNEDEDQLYELLIYDYFDYSKIEKRKAEVKIKNLLLSKISHEFKTPTINIQNIIENIIRESNIKNTLDSSTNPLAVSIYDDLKRVKYLSEIILILISDLGDYINNDRYDSMKNSPNSKLNKSLMNQSLQQNSIVSLRELKEYVIQLSKNLIDIYNKNNFIIMINFDMNVNKKKMVIDDKKLKQVICNILSNAIKNTDKGYIRISFVEDDLKRKDEVEFRIRKKRTVQLKLNNSIQINMIEGPQGVLGEKFNQLNSDLNPHNSRKINYFGSQDNNNSIENDSSDDDEIAKVNTPSTPRYNRILNKNNMLNKIKIIEEENDLDESSMNSNNTRSIKKKATSRLVQSQRTNRKQNEIEQPTKLDVADPIEEEKQTEKQFYILFEDTGTGIKKEVVNKINDSSNLLNYDHRFEDEKESGEYVETKGIGIGLIICKRLCKELNVNLTCQSIKKKKSNYRYSKTKIQSTMSLKNVDNNAITEAHRSSTMRILKAQSLSETYIKRVCNIFPSSSIDVKKPNLNIVKLTTRHFGEENEGTRFILEFSQEQVYFCDEKENESFDTTSYLQQSIQDDNNTVAVSKNKTDKEAVVVRKSSSANPINVKNSVIEEKTQEEEKFKAKSLKSVKSREYEVSASSSVDKTSSCRLKTIDNADTIKSDSSNNQIYLGPEERENVSFDMDSCSSADEQNKSGKPLIKLRRLSKSCGNINIKKENDPFSTSCDVDDKKVLSEKGVHAIKVQMPEELIRTDLKIALPEDTNIDNIIKLQKMNVSPRKIKFKANNTSDISKNNTSSIITNSIFANSISQNNTSNNANITEEFAFKRQSIINKQIAGIMQRKNTIFSQANPGGSILLNGSLVSIATDNRFFNEELNVSSIPKNQRKSVISQYEFFLDPEREDQCTCHQKYNYATKSSLGSASIKNASSIHKIGARRKSTFTFQNIEGIRHNSVRESVFLPRPSQKLSNYNLNKSTNSMYNIIDYGESNLNNMSNKNSSFKNKSLSIIRDNNLQESSACSSNSSREKKKKILIVEDNDNILKSHYNLFKKFLASKGLGSSYSILMLKDGIEALYHVYKDVMDNSDSIKLILSDEMMTYLNGSELHELITNKIMVKSNRVPIPFIISSAFNNSSHFEKIAKLGVGLINKPLNKGNIEFIYENYLANT